MIVVDDNSNDGSEETIAALASEGYPVSIIVRKHERGLSSAVVAGFLAAKHDVLVCMDADLQHDPGYLPALVAPIVGGEADFCVGSRNVQDGRVEDWPLIRRAISFGATLLSRPLTSCSDPMSGFFCLHKATFANAVGLNPMGYKIGLELMIRCNAQNIREIPIVFRDREAGESKLTMKQNLLYLRQLVGLYWAVYPLGVILVILALLAVLVYIYFLLMSFF